VALSPIPIIGVVLVLDSERARRNGSAFALGWVAGLTIVSVLVVLVAGAASDPGSEAATGINWFMAGIGVAFFGDGRAAMEEAPEARRSNGDAELDGFDRLDLIDQGARSRRGARRGEP
jgi:hypothetical protein